MDRQLVNAEEWCNFPLHESRCERLAAYWLGKRYATFACNENVAVAEGNGNCCLSVGDSGKNELWKSELGLG